ncbi:hypothetical protein PIB30_079239, partial [Stylosanthes scabra]|nr:hypothetical protein [Stylosanthes scabra]
MQTWWLTFDGRSCREIQGRRQRHYSCWPLRRYATGDDECSARRRVIGRCRQRRGGELLTTNKARSDSMDKRRKGCHRGSGTKRGEEAKTRTKLVTG